MCVNFAGREGTRRVPGADAWKPRSSPPGASGSVAKWIEPGSNVYTDENTAYRRLDVDLGFTHKYVTHGREYVSGVVHTNGIENFWSLLKRAIKGTQIHVSPKHLDRYVTERQFAYDYRDTNDLGRMRLATAGTAGRRLTWKELTSHP